LEAAVSNVRGTSRKPSETRHIKPVTKPVMPCFRLFPS